MYAWLQCKQDISNNVASNAISEVTRSTLSWRQWTQQDEFSTPYIIVTNDLYLDHWKTHNLRMALINIRWLPTVHIVGVREPPSQFIESGANEVPAAAITHQSVFFKITAYRWASFSGKRRLRSAETCERTLRLTLSEQVWWDKSGGGT